MGSGIIPVFYGKGISGYWDFNQKVCKSTPQAQEEEKKQAPESKGISVWGSFFANSGSGCFVETVARVENVCKFNDFRPIPAPSEDASKIDYDINSTVNGIAYIGETVVKFMLPRISQCDNSTDGLIFTWHFGDGSEDVRLEPGGEVSLIQADGTFITFKYEDLVEEHTDSNGNNYLSVTMYHIFQNRAVEGFWVTVENTRKGMADPLGPYLPSSLPYITDRKSDDIDSCQNAYPMPNAPNAPMPQVNPESTNARGNVDVLTPVRIDFAEPTDCAGEYSDDLLVEFLIDDVKFTNGIHKSGGLYYIETIFTAAGTHKIAVKVTDKARNAAWATATNYITAEAAYPCNLRVDAIAIDRNSLASDGSIILGATNVKFNAVGLANCQGEIDPLFLQNRTVEWHTGDIDNNNDDEPVIYRGSALDLDSINHVYRNPASTITLYEVLPSGPKAYLREISLPYMKTPGAPQVMIAGPRVAFVGETVNYEANITDPSFDPADWQIRWTFPDTGEVVTASIASHVFTTVGLVPVTLELVNNLTGAVTSPIFYQVETYEMPLQVSISAPDHAPNGKEVTFSLDANVVDPALYYVVWDFGDGSPQEGPLTAAPHTFSQTGDFTVRANIYERNPDGSRGDLRYYADHRINIHSDAAYIKYLRINPTHCLPSGSGCDINFTSEIEAAQGRTLQSIQLTYGDGNQDTITPGTNTFNFNRQHTYLVDGKYNAELIVTDNMSEIVRQNIEVDATWEESGAPYINNFIINPTHCKPSVATCNINFRSDIEAAPGRTIQSITLDYEDGSSAYQVYPGTSTYNLNVTHQYTVDAKYDARLTVTDNAGYSKEMIMRVDATW